ncbi:XRE family transcriptional regulator [Corynebacterium sp. NML 150383]|uniref:short-chain fatty acyl-CoA regulator family protein n=1 Tax=Corynebacterium sp. NML 150383 TaxID=2029400 RepID=UPI000BAA6AC5|nr:short-chain fatty acyl-CoA regulator family protein [Corynebacterium sp. NML 150383]PAT04494.1 XRE family transcriptional regulator [Corynebacterium sp. NML 150383]
MTKHYAGARIHTLRANEGLTQVDMARKLGISTSYLNQLENDQRPLTVTVLLQLTQVFGLDATFFSPDAEQRVAGELAELLPGAPESELAEIALRYPAVAQGIKDLPGMLAGAASNPHIVVRDFFQQHNNYFHDLDTAAEDFATPLHARQLRLTRIAAVLDRDFGYTVRFNQYTGGERSAASADAREIRLRTGLSEAQQCFELSYHYARIAHGQLLDAHASPIANPRARQLARHGLAQYFAAAATMPYSLILEAAEETRYDVDVISARFGTGFESTCQRLGTLQRPGATAIPFVFIRTDRAGNISKRQSTTSFHFSQRGGTCPLWVVHRAFETSNRVTRQVSVMPDGRTYMWVARMVQGPAVEFGKPRKESAVALGCDAAHADRMVYADGLDLSPDSATPIGPGCETCPRHGCPQRAFPAL